MGAPQVKQLPAGTFAEGSLTRGTIVGWQPERGILIELEAAPGELLLAATIVHLTEQELNEAAAKRQSILLAFEDADPRKPVVVGLLAPIPAPDRPSQPDASVGELPTAETVVIRGRDAIELRCGDACITLRSDGRILIRGTNIISRASEQNRVAGGSIHFN
jgi:hypothetical protein